MTFEERLDRISEKLDLSLTVNASHDDQIGKLVDHVANLSGRMDVLTERTIQAMDAINRLANIAASHEDRIGDLEDKE